jgi:hypothetical protein
MKNARRRAVRAVLLPLALLIVVLGSALPANAQSNNLAADPSYSFSTDVGPFSLSW